MAGTQISRFDQKLQRGLGKVAAKIGQTYDGYRLSSATNVGVVSGTPILPSFRAATRRTTKKVALGNAAFDLLTYVVDCDNRQLQLGDTFVETGYKTDGAVFTYAQQRPMQETIWLRTEFNIFISRPSTRAGASNQQPESGALAQPRRAGTYKGIERILKLANGDYSLSTLGESGVTPANVQAGLQPLNRIKDGKEPDLPTTLYREHFLAYLPLMPGFQPNELDRLNFPNADRYEIALVFTSEDVGLSGYICIVEKLGT
jgi:hypothetical protein